MVGGADSVGFEDFQVDEGEAEEGGGGEGEGEAGEGEEVVDVCMVSWAFVVSCLRVIHERF